MIEFTFPLINNEICSITTVSEEDAAAVLDYLEKIASETDYLSFGPNELNLSIENERKFINSMGKPNLMLKATVNTELVSILTFEAGHLPRLAHAGEISISVLASYWGKKIASTILIKTIEYLRTLGFKKLFLRVRSDNQKAINLYQKLGFNFEGLVKNDIRINSTFYDTCFYGLNL